MASPLSGMIGVMDDEPRFVRGLAGLLRRDGYRVGTAGHGARALAQLQALD
jgi:CheY-like chemotaxis protein